MKLKPLNFVLILLLIGLSCKTEKSERKQIPAEVINIGKGENVRLSTIIDSVSYIVLDDKEILGRIFKLKIGDDGFYIHDNLGKAIVKYDNFGKFIYKIQKSGKGPGEYFKITDFILNKNKVEILNAGGHKRLWFDERGEYLKETKILSMDFNHAYLNDSTIVAYHHPGMNLKSGYAFHLWDKTLTKLVNEDIKFDPYKDKFMNGSLYPFAKNHGGFSFSGDFSNMIYSIDENGLIEPKYELNFTYYEWPSEDVYKKFYNTNPYTWHKGMEPYVQFLNFIETDVNCYAGFYVKGERYNVFYGKEDRKVICVDNFIDDIGLGLTKLNVVGHHNGFWYATAQIYEMDDVEILKENGFIISDDGQYIIIKFTLLQS